MANLDVFVRDRDGRPVHGLTAEDFRILQDGVEMQMSNFTALSGGAATVPMPSATTDDAPISRETTAPRSIEPGAVVLLFDNENLDPLDRNRVMRRVRGFVDDVMAAPVRVMVVTTRRSVTVEQPLTDDVGAVLRALDRVSKKSGARIALDAERRRILEDLERFANDAIRESMVDYLNDLETQVIKAQMQGRINAHIEHEVGVLKDTLRNLHEVVRLVSGIDGRRSVVYVSNGLAMTPGLELMHEFAETFLDNTIYARIGERTLASEFRDLADVANREGVSLYTIDASGIEPPLRFAAADRFVPTSTASWVATANRQESLGYIADATGGIAVLDSNDVSDGLLRIREDFANFYSIGYRISATGRDTAHRIEVQLPDHPDYEIRHRRWYVEQSLDTRVRQRVLQALIRDIGINPLDLRLAAGDAVKIRGKRWEVPLIVSIPVNRLGVDADEDYLMARIELFVGVRDERRRETPVHRRALELRIPRSGFAPDREMRTEISLPMVFRKERHAVVVGVVDRATDQTSYVRMVIDVP